VTVAKKQKYFQTVEAMLYDYKYLDQAIANLEAELEAIMPQTSTSVVKLGQGSTKTPFDTSQTERWGIKRADSRLRARLLEKRRHKKAIKAVREQLTDEENTFIWLRYDHEKTHDEVMEALESRGHPYSRRQYFYMRKQIINKIARYMGILE
jgi:DNA-directed RNA polymerase specialized sigma subunit